jgi:hypothetical protein
MKILMNDDERRRKKIVNKIRLKTLEKMDMKKCSK